MEGAQGAEGQYGAEGVEGERLEGLMGWARGGGAGRIRGGDKDVRQCPWLAGGGGRPQQQCVCVCARLATEGSGTRRFVCDQV